jgi:hypothetical protein
VFLRLSTKGKFGKILSSQFQWKFYLAYPNVHTFIQSHTFVESLEYRALVSEAGSWECPNCRSTATVQALHLCHCRDNNSHVCRGLNNAEEPTTA